jgi:hypothetical protein
MNSIDLFFRKLSLFPRIAEPVLVATPHPAGEIKDTGNIAVTSGAKAYPSQSKATSRWADGSVRWLLTRFQADLPGNSDCVYTLIGGNPALPEQPVSVKSTAGGGATLGTGALEAVLGGPEESIIESVASPLGTFKKNEFKGPFVTIDGTRYDAVVGNNGWQIIENGPVYAAVRTSGRHKAAGSQTAIDFELTIGAWAGKRGLEFEYRIINKEEGKKIERAKDQPVRTMADGAFLDIEAMGIEIRPETGPKRFFISREHQQPPTIDESATEKLKLLIDEFYIKQEYMEGSWETYAGICLCGWTDEKRGVTLIMHQAYQNYPKALDAEPAGLCGWIVPPEVPVRFFQGCAKRHRFLICFHGAGEDTDDLNIRALQYEIPDKPVIGKETYLRAGIFTDYISAKAPDPGFERILKNMAYSSTGGQGMFNFGDYWDGASWNNNEYDTLHWLLVQYVRTGDRAMLDKMLVLGEHQIDIDICHYTHKPFRLNGAIEHSAEHAMGNVAACHQWAEGILDYYHHTGDERALETARLMVKNLIDMLELHLLPNSRYGAPRQMGWVLRAISSVYAETWDSSLLSPCEKIVRRFQEWQDEFGCWLSYYTLHSQVRVPFMQSVGIRGLGFFESIKSDQQIRKMVVHEVDDIIKNCTSYSGRPYYKELPNLQMDGLAGHWFECLLYAYRYTGNKSYIVDNKKMFTDFVNIDMPHHGGGKGFASEFPGIVAFAKALEELE